MVFDPAVRSFVLRRVRFVSHLTMLDSVCPFVSPDPPIKKIQHKQVAYPSTAKHRFTAPIILSA